MSLERAGGGTPEREGAFPLGLMITIAGAHFVHDVFTAIFAPLLPLLIEKLAMSLALAGALSVLLNLPSLLNPWLGVLVDRLGAARWLVIGAPLLTSIGMSLVGVAPSAGALAVILLITGFSVAALHLGAPVLIAEVAGPRLGRGTSLFMVGGELARTAGPLIAVEAVLLLGLEGLWKLIAVGAAATAVLWWRLGGLPSGLEGEGPRPEGLLASWRQMGRTLAAVGGVLLARALTVAAIAVFLPTLLHSEGATLWFASLALAVFELAGAAGALTSGTLSDRLGRRWVLLALTALSPLSLLLFLWLGRGLAALPLLAALGFLALASSPVSMAVMLERSGGNRAVASGTFMMMTFTIRSAVVPAVGALGDVTGLRGALQVCAIAAFVGVPFAAMVPKAER